MKSARDFFSEEEKKQIADAIAAAERNTSGEIRVHIEDHCPLDVLNHAISVFKKIGMDRTELQNGALFYFAVQDRKFAVVADKGINDAVPADFWDVIRTEMQKEFQDEHFVEGLCKAIETTGEKLKKFFPLREGDKNELPNEISSE
jgi:uncharacterized membrane protein